MCINCDQYGICTNRCVLERRELADTFSAEPLANTPGLTASVSSYSPLATLSRLAFVRQSQTLEIELIF